MQIRTLEEEISNKRKFSSAEKKNWILQKTADWMSSLCLGQDRWEKAQT